MACLAIVSISGVYHRNIIRIIVQPAHTTPCRVPYKARVFLCLQNLPCVIMIVNTKRPSSDHLLPISQRCEICRPFLFSGSLVGLVPPGGGETLS